jgi:hypothetical protein
MRNLFVSGSALLRKDPGDLDRLSQAQDDVLTEGFRMRGFKVFLPSYLGALIEDGLEGVVLGGL